MGRRLFLQAEDFQDVFCSSPWDTSWHLVPGCQLSAPRLLGPGDLSFLGPLSGAPRRRAWGPSVLWSSTCVPLSPGHQLTKPRHLGPGDFTSLGPLSGVFRRLGLGVIFWALVPCLGRLVARVLGTLCPLVADVCPLVAWMSADSTLSPGTWGPFISWSLVWGASSPGTWGHFVSWSLVPWRPFVTWSLVWGASSPGTWGPLVPWSLVRGA